MIVSGGNLAKEPVQKRPRGRPRTTGSGEASGSVKALDRALILLKLLAETDGLTLTGIAERTGMAPSTAYRLLSSLQGHGLVHFQDDEQRWQIGVETYRIGSAFLRRTKVADVSRTAMRALMEATQETVNLGVADDADVVFVSQVETHQPIRAFFRPGSRGPMHASGIGKALLSHFPRERVESLARIRGLQSFTGRTITDEQTLLGELAASRERGWALDDEERTEGMRCIASAIFNHFGEPVAGISISGPSVRLPDDRLAEVGEQVHAAADGITRSIGGYRPA